MKLEYDSYAHLRAEFSWSEAWDLVDGSPDAINATHECLDRHAGTAAQVKYADGTAETLRYGTLSTKAAQFAHLLDDLGVTADDRVAIMLNPSESFLVSFFGTMKHGAAAVPCSELFGPDALSYRLQDSGAVVLVTAESVAERIDVDSADTVLTRADLDARLSEYPESYDADTAADDEAWVQYTSGTTGRPTAVPYQHESIAMFAPVMDFVLDFDDADTCFTTSSTGWGTGIWMGTFTPLVHGITAGFYSGAFDPTVALEGVDEFDANVLIGVVPTAYRKLVNALEETDVDLAVERASYVGEPMDPDLSRDVEAYLGAFPRSTYGVTEVRSIITADFAFPDYEFRHGSMGKPMPGLEVTVVDEDESELPPGEIGYIAVRRGGRLIITSDAGYYDEDGYFWSAGRMDDTIISAGYTIGPQEVEDSLRSHPAVAEAGVIGVPDDERGEVVKAFLEVTEAPSDELREDIRSYVRAELSKHEYPREIEFIDDVPTTPDGKIRRPALREREGLEEPG
ncbi:MAG: acyl-CoA synthetase [Salinirussus sp.]